MNERRKKRCCVIGAGPSGLVTIKELLAEGHEVVCFEASGDLAGAFSPRHASESSKIYDQLFLTVSNYYMAFSDFPPPPHQGYRYWTAQEYYDYLHAYASAFSLHPAIRYRARVSSVSRLQCPSPPFLWQVSCADGSEHLFDAVAVCTGANQSHADLLAQHPSLASFSGEVSHVADFCSAAPYRGRRCLVVGLGESGADVVREISEVSASCALLVRALPFSIRRLNKHGVPADSHTTRMFFPYPADSPWVWLLVIFFVCAWYYPLYRLGLLRWWHTYPDADAAVSPAADGVPVDGMGQAPRGAYYDHKTPRDPAISRMIAAWHAHEQTSHLNKFATKNVSYFPNILSGKIQMYLGSIHQFTPDGVQLASARQITDHTSLLSQDPPFSPPSPRSPNSTPDCDTMHTTTTLSLDAILFATGYTVDFSFIEARYRPPRNDVRGLFKHAFHPDAGHSLCYIGFARPTTGAQPAVSEMTARYFARLVSGTCALPREGLSALIEEEAERESAAFHKSAGLRTLVNPLAYMDGLARLIGCWPNPLRYAGRPGLFMRLQTCTDLACRYRLVGPHAAPRMAEQWILRALTSDTPMQCVVLSLQKIAYLTGLWGTGDPILDFRALGIDLTSRQNRFQTLIQKCQSCVFP